MQPSARPFFALITEEAASDARQREWLIPGNGFTFEHSFKWVRLRHNGRQTMSR